MNIHYLYKLIIIQIILKFYLFIKFWLTLDSLFKRPYLFINWFYNIKCCVKYCLRISILIKSYSTPIYFPYLQPFAIICNPVCFLVRPFLPLQMPILIILYQYLNTHLITLETLPLVGPIGESRLGGVCDRWHHWYVRLGPWLEIFILRFVLIFWYYLF